MRSMYPAIIFFTESFNPTKAEREAAAKYGPAVRFRNAQFVPPDVTDGSVEQCDGVAGLVPAAYARLRPSGEDALRKHMDEMREFMQDDKPVKLVHSELGSSVVKAAAEPVSAPEPQPAPAPSPFAGKAPLPFPSKPKPAFGNPKAKSGPPGFGA